ncbi:MAG: gamma-glutamyltransferase [Pseudomonadota bacterium]
MTSNSWQVSSGHAVTTDAAAEILDDGGNAFDALIAAAWAACVAEPIFCSPGGGAHALLQPAHAPATVLDCFTQTPLRKRTDRVDFYPIQGNFGTDTQEFHVGAGAAATPGLVPGLWSLWQRYASMPMHRLAEPAIRQARDGVELNRTQALALAILEPIVRSSAAAARVFGLDDHRVPLPIEGETVTNAPLAHFLERVCAADGLRAYQHQIADLIGVDSDRHGGHLQAEDIHEYQVTYRSPLEWTLGPCRVQSNPPPAFGGMMVALMTMGLERRLPADAQFGSAVHLQCLLQAMQASQDDRKQLEQPECLRSDELLLQTYRTLNRSATVARKGTTHISIRDAQHNLAAMTLSNGEGSGQVVADCGFMLNNMLGEEDLNRLGFHHWPENRRLASMMAPTLIEWTHDDVSDRILLGSGGANRIRTAIAQVICNQVHFGMSLQHAIDAPRMHLEDDALAIEWVADEWPDTALAWLDQHVDESTVRWPARNLYFGGVHAVSDHQAAADRRRDGAARSGAR